MKQHNFNKVFDLGVAYLSSIQEKDGSFINLFSANSNIFTNSPSYHTTFTTSLILSVLYGFEESLRLKIIKEKAAKFLLSQKSEYWSWNYWVRNSKEAKQMPYPDDLDDTFCALNALFLCDKKIIDGEVLANIVNLLTSLEIREGGPYKTWLVDKKAKKIWSDVDLAVNSNIAYFLFLNEIEIPNLSRFINSKIAKLNFSSPYYPSPFPIIYFISRFYNGDHKEKIINFLLEKQNKNGTWKNPLNTALAASSLLRLGYPKENLLASINFLLKNQKNGHWQTSAFWLDPSIKHNRKFAGSDALTTAFCLETLFHYNSIGKIPPQPNKATKTQEKIYNTILQNVEKRLSYFDDSFKTIAYSLINRLTKNNTDKQILLLPYFFAQSLGDNNKKKIPENLLIKLGQANLFGWIAYTIYDNFLDGEGEPKHLSLANVVLREAQNIFLNILPDNKDWQIFYQKILDQIDAANYWEVTNCRDKNLLPDYQNYDKLAEKSFGHALGPLTILFYLHHNETSSDVKQLSKFFKHYIIARQLNDDAHDWEKDLKITQINPVGTLILKKQPDANITRYRKLFWEEIIDEVSLIILGHVKKGKLALKKCSIISDKSVFENMISKYENMALTALEEKKQTMKFLKTYKK